MLKVETVGKKIKVAAERWLNANGYANLFKWICMGI